MGVKIKKELMMIALNEATKAYNKNEVPVGAIIIKNGKILAKNHNQKITLSSPLAHAEILCINNACKKLKTWRLDDCEMYVTLEPCKMCDELIKECRIKQVYYLIKRSSNKVSYKKTKCCEYQENDLIKKDYKTMMAEFFDKLR